MTHSLHLVTRPALLAVLVAGACSAMAAERLDLASAKANAAGSGAQTIHGLSGLGASDLKPINTSAVNGQNVTRFQQYHRGVPILGEFIVVKGGGNAATSAPASVSGAILRNLSQDLPSVRPTLTQQAALDQAKTLARTQQTSKEQVNLYIRQGANGAGQLVYIVSFVNDSAATPSRPVSMIDANSGAVLDQWEGFDKRDGSGPGGGTADALAALAKTPGWNAQKAGEFMRYANDMYWTANSDARQGSCGAEKAALDLGYKTADVAAAFATAGKCRSSEVVDLAGTTLAKLSSADENIQYVFGGVNRFGQTKNDAATQSRSGNGTDTDTDTDKSAATASASTKYAYGGWSRITWDDLTHMGQHSNSDFARGRFKAVMGSDKTPVNVDVNDVKLGSSGQNPNATYSWWVNKRLVGTGQISDIPGFNGWTHVNGYNATVKRNYGTTVLKLAESVFATTATTQSTNWSVSATAGVKVGGKVGIPLVTEGSVEVSFSVTGTGGGSTSVTMTQPFYAPAISVPVGYEAVFELVERWKPVSAVWSVPLEISGLVGADYGPGQWNGHYFWALNGASYFYEYGNRAGAERYMVNLNQKYGIEMVVRAWTRPRTG